MPVAGAQQARTDQVRGRLDAVLIAARVAPLTRHIGLVPTVVATHTEPFHISKAIATLDYVSSGRAGLRVRCRRRPARGRALRPPRHPRPASGGPGRPAVRKLTADLFDEAADYIEVVRRLWDSWEDDAEITGRRHRPLHRPRQAALHRLRGTGTSASRAPRSPPGRRRASRLVTALAHESVPYQLVARSADIGYVTPHDADQAPRHRRRDPRGTGRGRRADEPLHVFGDLVVFLDDDPATGGGTAQGPARRPGGRRVHQRRPDLHRHPRPTRRSAAGVAAGAGLTGFRLRPGVVGHDLPAITRGLVPELQRRGVVPARLRGRHPARTARPGRPANRYAASPTAPTPPPRPAATV